MIKRFISLSFILITLVLFNANISFISAQKKDSDSLDKIDQQVETVFNSDEITTPESGINVTISPLFINLFTDPGKTVESSFKIRNNNNFDEYFTIWIAKYSLVESAERPVISEVSSDDPFPNWIEFDQREFKLLPNETKQIKFKFTPPDTAALGYYYAIVISRIKEISLQGRSAVVSASPAISLLAEVNSPYAKKEIQLLDFNTDKVFYEYLPVEFQVKVSNTGNIHLSPFGDIFIDSINQDNVGKLRVNPTSGNVLPQMQRIYTVKWNDGFPFREKKDDGKEQLVWDWSKANKFRFGKYTAHLILVYDNGERDVPIEAEVSFWVIPWKLILILLLFLFFFIQGVRLSLISLTAKFISSSRK
ncbi:MAG: hypothetical protein KatS3mg090_0688 [Patescibacteria group bacterium]|nr:MAG: hypothetical protein KatS3mg090_0688 [Patescibacteria group bacterium]